MQICSEPFSLVGRLVAFRHNCPFYSFTDPQQTQSVCLKDRKLVISRGRMAKYLVLLDSTSLSLGSCYCLL